MSTPSAESYKHKFAKATLAQWLREVAEGHCVDRVCLSPIEWQVNRGGPHYGVWTEYPVCVDDKNFIIGEQAWDEAHWGDPNPALVFDKRPPTYDEVIQLGLLPIVIFDIAVQHKGIIIYGLEVVHRHGISQSKLAYLKRIGIRTYAVDADWILSQSRRPQKLVCDLVL